MIGAGKYDDLCTLVREQAEAKGVLLIVLEGNKGNGFSCQATALHVLTLPEVLRYMADEIDKGGISI